MADRRPRPISRRVVGSIEYTGILSSLPREIRAAASQTGEGTAQSFTLETLDGITEVYPGDWIYSWDDGSFSIVS